MNSLNLQQLEAMGGFIGSPVQREVVWRQGSDELRGVVYVLPLSYHSAKADLIALASNGDSIAGRIASCILDEFGKPIFTVADITGESSPERGALNGNLTMALLALIGEVSNEGKRQS